MESRVLLRQLPPQMLSDVLRGGDEAAEHDEEEAGGQELIDDFHDAPQLVVGLHAGERLRALEESVDPA